MKRLLLLVFMMLLIGFKPSASHGLTKGIPDILITEISAAKAEFKFIELYNNTNSTIDLKDYNLRYLSMHNNMEIWDFTEPGKIYPNSSLVVWFHRKGDKKNLKDFNHYYQTKLAPYQVNRLDASLSNSGKHTFVLATDTGAVISYISFDQKHQHYQYNNHSKKLKQIDLAKKSTPGYVDSRQIPNTVNQKSLEEKPIVNTIEAPSEIPERTDVALEFQIEGKELIKRAEIVYKRAQDSEYQRDNLFMKTTTTYQALISRNKVYGSNPTFDYYLEISDGKNIVRYPTKGHHSITIGNPEMYKPLKAGLSVQNDSILHGTTTIQVHKEDAKDQVNLLLDGRKLETEKTLSRPATLVYEGVGIDERKKDVVMIRNRLISRLKPTEGTFAPHEVTIPIDVLKPGKNKLSIHTGDKKEPYISGKTIDSYDMDNFTLKNVKLLLGDGTILYPMKTIELSGEGEENKRTYKADEMMEFGNRGALVRAFQFDVPKEKFLTEQAEIDTSDYPDGRYKITATGPYTDQANVLFDNTPPVLKIKAPVKGKKYKGTFTIDAEAEDLGSPHTSIKAYLDEREIQIPYTTSSGKLAKGDHTVKFLSTDEAGNRKSKSIDFTIVDETPVIQDDIEPFDNQENVSTRPKLSVRIQDPTNDHLRAKFYLGNRYDFSKKDRNRLTAFSNIANEEPPPVLVLPRESSIRKEEMDLIARQDGTYWITQSNQGFPYQRFSVPIQEPLKNVKSVELKWTGHSLPGRRVTLYAWNYQASKWDAMAYGFGNKDFSLKAEADVARYVKHKEIQVIVQDQIIDEVNRPFTLIWMSDTQYYSESFQHVYPVMTNWIRVQNQLGNAEYVIHTGDIVNIRWSEDEWRVADKSMKILDDAHVPYGVVAGNHDVGNFVLDYRNFGKYFGEKRFKHSSHYGGGLENNTHHYDLASFGGHDFIFIYLGFGKETEPTTIKWANKILKKYSERNAILSIHSYLKPNGRRNHNGEKVFKEIVEPNENIKMVLAGHIPGVSRHIETILMKTENGKIKTRKVYEMLADYQSGPEGGQGYMRILQFNPTQSKLNVKTYSPYLDDYNFFETEQEEFSFSHFELNPVQKKVATDYLGINVYTNKLLGEDKDGKSNHKVKLKLKGLRRDEEYYWYVEVSDRFGGWSRSPIWKFTTKD